MLLDQVHDLFSLMIMMMMMMVMIIDDNDDDDVDGYDLAPKMIRGITREVHDLFFRR